MSENNDKASAYANKLRDQLTDFPAGYCSAQIRNLVKAVYLDALDGFIEPSDTVVYRSFTVRERMK